MIIRMMIIIHFILKALIQNKDRFSLRVPNPDVVDELESPPNPLVVELLESPPSPEIS